MYSFIKRHFPFIYEMGLHLRRKREINEIERIKTMSSQQQRDMVSNCFEKYIGHKLNWDNLSTYTEKMQYEKLYNIYQEKVDLSDKYKVRAWVSDKIGSKYLIPLLGVWDNFKEIDFSTLPNSFVLKTNHGSGSVMIVKDKTHFNKFYARLRFNDWMRTDYGYKPSLEKHYSLIDRKIIAEQYLENGAEGLQDYKFLCFDGKPYYCWVDIGRFSHHTRNVYDMEWRLQPWNQASKGLYPEPIPEPKSFAEMKRIASILCEGFKHVRVDLYCVDDSVYFGEMTFTNGGGYDPILPPEYDRMLGDLWPISIE